MLLSSFLIKDKALRINVNVTCILIKGLFHGLVMAFELTDFGSGQQQILANRIYLDTGFAALARFIDQYGGSVMIYLPKMHQF